MAKQLSSDNRAQREKEEKELQDKIREETETLKIDLEIKSNKIKELEGELVLAESQFARAVADSEASADRAASKDKDMTELMKSIQDIQSAGQRREEEANKQRRAAESTVSELEKTLAVTKGELNVFNHERSTLKDTLDGAKQERQKALDKLDGMKDQVDELKADLNSTMSQLTLEKELRARSEQKEREERNERIALSAQMVAMTKEHSSMETTLNESKDVLETKWRRQIEVEEDKLKDKQKELDDAKERIIGLQGEIEALKNALKDEKNIASAENAEEMGRLAAQIEIMKERLRAEENRSAALGHASESKVESLEKTIREGQAERRRMHNLIQELRGNVRVFARIRPFLPNDGVDDDEPAMCVPKSETALKLVSRVVSDFKSCSCVVSGTLPGNVSNSEYSALIIFLFISSPIFRQLATPTKRVTISVLTEFLDQVLDKKLSSPRFPNSFSQPSMDTMSVFSLMDRQEVEKLIPCKVLEMDRCVVLFLVRLNKLVSIRSNWRRMDGNTICRFPLLRFTMKPFVTC